MIDYEWVVTVNGVCEAAGSASDMAAAVIEGEHYLAVYSAGEDVELEIFKVVKESVMRMRFAEGEVK